MSYKKASKLRLRFKTSKGILTTEQLWDLSQVQLADLIKKFKKKLKKETDDELAFLADNAVQVDETTQLQFDVVKDIFLTRKSEIEALQNASKIKARNQRILEVIDRKKNAELDDMSIDDLTKLLE